MILEIFGVCFIMFILYRIGLLQWIFEWLMGSGKKFKFKNPFRTKLW